MQGPRLVEAKTGPAPQQRRGQGLNPAQEPRQSALIQKPLGSRFDQRGHPLEIIGLKGMVNCVVWLTFPFEPSARAAVQTCDALRRQFPVEKVPQQVSEQVMVAIPAPLIVQRHQEQVTLLKLRQHLLAA